MPRKYEEDDEDDDDEVEEDDDDEVETKPKKIKKEKVVEESGKIQLVTENQLLNAKLDHIINLLEKN